VAIVGKLIWDFAEEPEYDLSRQDVETPEFPAQEKAPDDDICSDDDPYEKCKAAAKGGPREWNDFCSTLLNPQHRAMCRAKQFANQTEKENMCHFFFL
jgi:hypothetical protein